ncbi:FimV family protein [Xenophilus sp. Marseille-Q4582]|uniref:type IV pilus assembly protein FimV n=1 Tax=Xenophilus sp. Marseille-Q4582 TaxID=2866600 RepID=UPI001CE40F1B|nr:FimV/HubP family polar landmark protein [Xenophilus sp. Marseille-Q4582]
MAAALALGFAATDADALTLGRLNVQSALGEPLRAEVEVSEIGPGEAEGLRINLAPRAAFQAAGVSYNDALAHVQTTLQRRADGRYVVRLAGTRPMSEPFVDLLLEANWASGRIVRDYTLLLDPPSSTRQAAAPVAPTAPQIVNPQPRVTAAPPAVSAAPAPRAPLPQATAPAAAPVRTESAGGGGQQITVQRGDTAGRIAAAHKPADVSLDQMLVALLRANPDAFIGGNVNRMRAGAVLQMPSASEAAATPAAEARRTVVAQSRDFSQYRRRLAENAPTSQVAAADRQASGRLQANVQERNANAASPDRLTIAQGGAAARAEERIAQTRQAEESSARVGELQRNIDELNRIQGASASAAPAAAPAASAPAAARGAAASAAPAATAATAATPAPTVAPAPAPAAAAPAPAAGAAAPAGPAAAPAAAVPGPTIQAAPPVAAPAAPTAAPTANADAPAPRPPPLPRLQ